VNTQTAEQREDDFLGSINREVQRDLRENPPPPPVTCLGPLFTYAVPSKSKPGTDRYVIHLTGASYWCSCEARTLCWHVEAVKALHVNGERP
jgi:hypothetical protein